MAAILWSYFELSCQKHCIVKAVSNPKRVPNLSIVERMQTEVKFYPKMGT